jgi:hypothetical protein
MAKRWTDNTMAKRWTDNTMAKRWTDNTMAKRWTDNTMVKRKRTNTIKQTNCLCYIFFNSKLMFTPRMKKLIDITTWLPL